MKPTRLAVTIYWLAVLSAAELWAALALLDHAWANGAVGCLVWLTAFLGLLRPQE